MGLVVVTPPSSLAVSLDEAKAQLRILDTSEDTYVTSLLNAAISHVERVLNKALVTQTLDYFQDTFDENNGPIYLPIAPIQSITTLKYLNSSNVLTTMTVNTEYSVDTYGPLHRLVPVGSWPSGVMPDVLNGIQVRFVAGYGAPTAVPADIKAAILIKIADLYKFRESVFEGSISNNRALDELLEPSRKMAI